MKATAEAQDRHYPRIDKVLDGERFRFSLGTDDAAEITYRSGIVASLHRAGQREVLRALAKGALDWLTLVAAEQSGTLLSVLDTLKLQRNLFAAVEEWLPRSAESPLTRERYAYSWRQLKAALLASEQIDAQSPIRDLQRVNWKTVQKAFPPKGRSWNLARQMVGTFLTDVTGHCHTAFRLSIMGYRNYPLAKKNPPRIPEINVAQFWSLVEVAFEPIQSAIVALVALGCRPSEFFAMQPSDLDRINLKAHIPGTKTEKSDGKVSVDARLWKYVEDAIPAKLQYKWLSIHFRRAVKDAGLENANLCLYGLRHLSAIFATQQGKTSAEVGTHLRHAAGSKMTGVYTAQHSSVEVASAIGDALIGGAAKPTTPAKARRAVRLA